MSDSTEEYDDEDIILADLPDDELIAQMHDDLYDGLKEEIEEGTNILLSRDWSAEKVLNKALVAGMKIVGIDFRDGKNLVGMMLEGAGFEVFDIGVNNSVEEYFAALEEHKPDILGMSALLTTTMPYMKVVIDEMVRKGIRDDYIVLVGGAPLNEEFGVAVGADRYCRDAAEAAAIAVIMMTERRESSD